MNGQIILGIIIMVLGTGIGTFLIQKGRTILALNSTTKLVEHINSLDKKSRNEILIKSKLDKDEIILLVNTQTKSSAVEIITEVENKFGIINENLIKTGSQVEALKVYSDEIKEEKALQKLLKQAKPDISLAGLYFKGEELWLKVEVKNIVPFKCSFRLYFNNKEITNSIALGTLKIHPKRDQRFFTMRYGMLSNINKAGVITMEEDVEIVVRFNYESIYFPESRDPNLKGVIEESFVLNVDNRSSVKK